MVYKRALRLKKEEEKRINSIAPESFRSNRCQQRVRLAEECRRLYIDVHHHLHLDDVVKWGVTWSNCHANGKQVRRERTAHRRFYFHLVDNRHCDARDAS